MLAVVVIGYFYTVRPVFQKEVVSEDLARLQIEQRKTQSKLDEQTKEIEKREQNIKTLADERKNIEIQIRDLKDKIAQTEKSEIDSKRRAQKALSEAKTAEKELLAAEGKLYEIKRSAITGKMETPAGTQEYLRHHWENIQLDIFAAKSGKDVSKKLESTFLQPLYLANLNLEKLKKKLEQSDDKKSSVDKKLMLDYQAGIARHQQALTCPTPDYQAWQEKFQESIQHSKKLVSQCAEKAFEKRISDEKWSIAEVALLKKTDFWKDQSEIYERGCIISVEFSIKRTFQDSWDKADEECKKRRQSVSSIVLGEPLRSELSSFGDLSPPSLELISQRFNADK